MSLRGTLLFFFFSGAFLLLEWREHGEMFLVALRAPEACIGAGKCL